METKDGKASYNHWKLKNLLDIQEPDHSSYNHGSGEWVPTKRSFPLQ